MSFLSRLFGKKKVKRAKIVLLGSSGSGKTTLVRFLETGKPVEDDPKTTLGIDIRKNPIKIENWELSAIDVGGQDLYRSGLWSLGVSQSNAVIYLIDGTVRKVENSDKFETSLFNFEYLLTIIDETKPLLVLVNKQDLKNLNPMTADEAIKTYCMNKLAGRSFIVLPSSAKFGEGVQTAMEWLIQKIVGD